MKPLFRWAFALSFLTSMVLGRAAQAYPTYPAAFPPFSYFGYALGVPYGYGYFPWYAWPNPFPIPGYTYAPGPLPRPPSVGAIAYSPSAGTGSTAWGYDDIDSAASNAVANCGQADCRAVVWVAGGCAAVSTSMKNGAIGWAYASTIASARQTARRACMASGGGHECIHRFWVCSW